MRGGAWVFRTALACQLPPKPCEEVVAMVGGYNNSGSWQQAAKEDCHGIPHCGPVRHDGERPVDTGHGRGTRREITLVEDESEEDVAQHNDRATNKVSTRQKAGRRRGNCTFVVDCADCPAGLNIHEQLTWAGEPRTQ